jgi:signal transduction histidine kinase
VLELVLAAELQAAGGAPDGLASYMRELAAGTALKHVRLEHEGTVLAGSGQPGDYPLVLPAAAGAIRRGPHLYAWRQTALRPAGSGHPATLVVVLDAAQVVGKGVRHGSLLLTNLILACAGIAVLGLAVSLLLRNLKLHQDLDAVARKRGQAEELSLAAAGLAHETKNPLGIIRGLAQQIAENPNHSDQARQKARDIMEEADVTTSRLGDFLSFARLRQPELTQIDAAAHIASVCNLIREDFQGKNVQLALHVDDLRIMADSEMLSQIVLNLLLNSQKATEAGGKVTVSLRQAARRSAMLVVADTGRGIAPEALPNLFKPYGSKRAGGYGIGMAIVKKLVDESGWDIAVHSELGRGTEVRITGIEVSGGGDPAAQESGGCSH